MCLYLGLITLAVTGGEILSKLRSVLYTKQNCYPALQKKITRRHGVTQRPWILPDCCLVHTSAGDVGSIIFYNPARPSLRRSASISNASWSTKFSVASQLPVATGINVVYFHSSSIWRKQLILTGRYFYQWTLAFPRLDVSHVNAWMKCMLKVNWWTSCEQRC